MSEDPRRALPRVDAVLAALAVDAGARALARDAVRLVLDEARMAGEPLGLDAAVAAARAKLRAWTTVRPQVVINATGVVLHTNLGRAPWSAAAVAAVAAVVGRYADVEVDLTDGERGGRGASVRDKLVRLTGAEDALVVNNGAAGVLLALSALARDRDVVVSRGELVEIGGSFRVPDVIACGGARLVSVGTTNRTRASDYASAVGPHTAALLKVHPSNFRMTGFVASASVAELADVARTHGLVVVADVGSGALDTEGDEPGVRDALRDGAHVVVCSGDKLLGGPQAGLVLGRRDVLAKLRQHPLARAVRVGKETLVALDATLAGWLSGDAPPAVALRQLSVDALRPRALAIAAVVTAAGGQAEVIDVDGRVGGGSLPEASLPSVAVRVRVDSAEAAVAALRRAEPPVLLRVVDDALVADVRTVFPDQDDTLAATLAAVAVHG